MVKSFRPSIFKDFVDTLKAANRGYMMNNMDILTLSMPLEYSLVNNYWMVHGIQLHLNHMEREIRYQQLI